MDKITKWHFLSTKILFILGSYNFLAYLECVKSYAWSKGHSEPDLSSVIWYIRPNYQQPFWYSKFLVHVIHYSTIYTKHTSLLKKRVLAGVKELSLYIYIRIPNTYLGLEFEFGPQRIRDLPFMCP